MPEEAISHRSGSAHQVAEDQDNNDYMDRADDDDLERADVSTRDLNKGSRGRD